MEYQIIVLHSVRKRICSYFRQICCDNAVIIVSLLIYICVSLMPHYFCNHCTVLIVSLIYLIVISSTSPIFLFIRHLVIFFCDSITSCVMSLSQTYIYDVISFTLCYITSSFHSALLLIYIRTYAFLSSPS